MDIFGTTISVNVISFVIISICFMIGLMLMIISPQSLQKTNEVLTKEHGITKRIIPAFENIKTEVIDKIVLKHLGVCGLIIAVTSFLLLLIMR